jgi:hypothetical protein
MFLLSRVIAVFGVFELFPPAFRTSLGWIESAGAEILLLEDGKFKFPTALDAGDGHHLVHSADSPGLRIAGQFASSASRR